MQIQRIQTLFLLLAIACVVAFLFVPFGIWDVVENQIKDLELVGLSACNYPALIVPVVVSAALMLIAVFSYKKMPLQKLLIVLAMLATLAAVGVMIYIMTRGFVGAPEGVTVKAVWSVGGIMLFAAIIAQWMAIRNIKRDQKLLASYDRLR